MGVTKVGGRAVRHLHIQAAVAQMREQAEHGAGGRGRIVGQGEAVFEGGGVHTGYGLVSESTGIREGEVSRRKARA
jgi:hypothetical protein